MTGEETRLPVFGRPRTVQMACVFGDRRVRHHAVRDGLYGTLFDTPGSDRGPSALVIGGSEGGLDTEGIAAVLASHGYAAMALAYFRAPGLPPELKNISLEYFASALVRLRDRATVDPRHTVVLGTSRGGEGALLIGATYPHLVHGVIALVPSNVVGPSPSDGRSPSWTLGGQAVAQVRREELGNPHPIVTPQAVIPTEQIDGPILTASAGRDAIWPSARYTVALHQRLEDRRFPYPHRNLHFQDAGHDLGRAVPDSPTEADDDRNAIAADEAAKAALWPSMLAFMGALGRT